MGATTDRSPRLRWAAVLGFALGGFFDGILLHQVLQWHHLLSLWPGAGDLTWHILWDGLFHGLMYALAALGIWGLWRQGMPRGRDLLGAILVGFGVWHVVDGVVSHWLLGLHHIRLEAESPLLWDLIWFVVFGLGPLAVGWGLLRRDRPVTRPGAPGPR